MLYYSFFIVAVTRVNQSTKVLLMLRLWWSLVPTGFLASVQNVCIAAATGIPCQLVTWRERLNSYLMEWHTKHVPPRLLTIPRRKNKVSPAQFVRWSLFAVHMKSEWVMNYETLWSKALPMLVEHANTIAGEGATISTVHDYHQNYVQFQLPVC